MERRVVMASLVIERAARWLSQLLVAPVVE